MGGEESYSKGRHLLRSKVFEFLRVLRINVLQVSVGKAFHSTVGTRRTLALSSLLIKSQSSSHLLHQLS